VSKTKLKPTHKRKRARVVPLGHGVPLYGFWDDTLENRRAPQPKGKGRGK
jgi:hypothetical protein